MNDDGSLSRREMTTTVPTVLHRLFEQHFGAPPTSEEPVAADASQRRMLRLWGAGGEKAAADGADQREPAPRLDV